MKKKKYYENNSKSETPKSEKEKYKIVKENLERTIKREKETGEIEEERDR
jgi:hypothetical protein